MWFLRIGNKIYTNKTCFSLIISSKNMKLLAWNPELFYIYYGKFCNGIWLTLQAYEIDLSGTCYEIIISKIEERYHFTYAAVVCLAG